MNRRIRRSKLNTAYVFFIPPYIWTSHRDFVNQNIKGYEKIRNYYVNPKCKKRRAAQKRHS